MRDIDFLLPISPVDKMKYLNLGYKGGIYTLPLGIDLKKYQVHIPASASRMEVGFIGSLDWRPNVEGLQWFLSKVWPKVQAAHPDTFRIHIAGRNMPEKIRNQASPDVIIHGEVADAIEFIERYNYFVVPLFSGSGMRVKILEAMAMGKIVLSTRIGIEGIPATPEKEYIKVNSSEEFLDSFARMAKDDYNIEILGRNARSFVEDNYGLSQVSSGFYNYLHEILRNSLQKVE